LPNISPPFISIFEHRKYALPSKLWLLTLLVLAGTAVILHQGVGVLHIGLFAPIIAIQHANDFLVDPLNSVVFPSTYPPFFRPFVDFYDIPALHLTWGICTKALLVSIYFFLSRMITGSSLAGLFAVAMFFGVADFHAGEFNILNLRIPVGFATFELRDPSYMSFRQTALIFGLLSTVLFLKERYIWSAVILGLGAYIHALNCLMFFLCFAVTLLFFSLTGSEKARSFRRMVGFIISFTLVLAPYLLSLSSMFPNLEPMSYPDFYNFMMKNEPDDFSVIYFVQFFKFLFFVGFLLAIFSGLLQVLFLSKKPISPNRLMTVFEQKNKIISLLLIPWLILIFAMVWEIAFVPHMPGFLNDFVNNLSLRRVTSISAIFYTIVLASFVANIVMTLTKLSLVEIVDAKGIDCVKRVLTKFKIYSLDTALALMLSILLLANVALLQNSNIGTFEKFLSTDHVSPDMFVPDPVYVYGAPGSNPQESLIPFLPFKEICLWIKKNTPIRSAFFQPTYIKEFRLLSGRQGFVAEKVDGSMAMYSRKFAVIYLQRFSDIHGGLSYDELSGTVLGRREDYTILRQRYLSLTEVDIERLRFSYPGYDYFLTEASHFLNYPILFENKFFRLYDVH
jgi:hypothetical protein